MKSQHFLFRLAVVVPLSTVFGIIAIFAQGASAQSPGASTASSNAITTYANGICITFVPGAAPILTASTIGTDSTPAVAIAVSKTLRYIDKHGKDIDPSTIKPGERLQALYDSGPNGPVIERVMVDRN